MHDRCVTAQPPLSSLPYVTDNTVIPHSMLQAARRHTPHSSTAAAAAATRLRGRCLILLGDSSVTETIHDLAILLHGLTSADRDEYVGRATRMPSAATEQLPNNRSVLRVKSVEAYFEPSHRKMWFRETSSDTVVLHRFIGHMQLDKNGMGLRSLSSEQPGSNFVRKELERCTAERCDNTRPRTLWLQSGYHDVKKDDARPGNLSLSFKSLFRSAIQWLESLASDRVWLTRHAAVEVNRVFKRAMAAAAIETIEEWVHEDPQGLALEKRGWAISRHRDVWQCSTMEGMVEAAAKERATAAEFYWPNSGAATDLLSDPATERRLPIHIGSIAMYQATERSSMCWTSCTFCCAYLCSLRTWSAIELTGRSGA